MIFSQSCPNYFPFLLSSLPLKLHFGHFPLFFFNIYPIFTFIACLPSPSALSFGYFPFLSSIYVQFSLPFHVFLLRAPCLLDIFLFFLQYMSNFHFHCMSSFSERPVFWIFPLFFFNICPIFTSISCLPSPSTLSFGYFPYFSSIYVQFSLSLHVFLLRAPCLLDIFLFFLQYMSNFPFHFMSSFSERPVFWIFPLFFFNICPIFTSISCLPSPSTLSFGYFPIFLQYMSNFHFHFMSSFSEYPVF